GLTLAAYLSCASFATPARTKPAVKGSGRMQSVAVRGILALALTAWPGALLAQSYPERPIHLIVPSAPGGANDVPARLLSQFLPDKLGQPAVMENRAGAGGAIGAALRRRRDAGRLYAAGRQHQRVRGVAVGVAERRLRSGEEFRP